MVGSSPQHKYEMPVKLVARQVCILVIVASCRKDKEDLAAGR